MNKSLVKFLPKDVLMLLLKDDIKAELLNYVSSSTASNEATIKYKTVF